MQTKAITLFIHRNDTDFEGVEGAVPFQMDKSWEWLTILTGMGHSLGMQGPVCRVWDSNGFEVKGKVHLEEGKLLYITTSASESFRQGIICSPPS